MAVEIGTWKLILGRADFERRAKRSKAMCEVSRYGAWLGQVEWEFLVEVTEVGHLGCKWLSRTED